MLLQNEYQVERNDPITQAHSDVAVGKVDESGLADVYRKAWQTATDEDLVPANFNARALIPNYQRMTFRRLAKELAKEYLRE